MRKKTSLRIEKCLYNDKDFYKEINKLILWVFIWGVATGSLFVFLIYYLQYKGVF